MIKATFGITQEPFYRNEQVLLPQQAEAVEMIRIHAQHGGFSTIIILTMSALGGSMFPRFLMSPGMQKLGLVTFNAWALDGYIKVFWRDAPLTALWPQLAVLTALTAVFLIVARLLARRWETM